MKHILFGINQNPNKAIENRILDKYVATNNEEFSFDTEYYLAGIEKALGEKNYDVLILREDLEINKQVSIQFLDRITDKYPVLNIILIVNDEHQSDRYIIDIFKLGIYNILYKEDLTLPNIVNLIDNVRTKIDAKIYLELEDANENKEEVTDEESMLEIEDEQLLTIMGNLKGATEENISELFDGISQQYNEKQMTFLVSLLTDDIRSLLNQSGNENYINYYNKLNNVVQKVEKEEVVEKNTAKKENFKEKVKVEKIYIEKEKIVEKKVVEKVFIEKEKEVKVYERPNDYKKKVGFVGFSGAGKTSLISLAADMLSTSKLKVAVVDLTGTRDLYDMNIFNNLDENEDDKKQIEGKNALISLVGGSLRPYKINKYVDLYTASYESKVDYGNPIYYLQLLEQEYDVILVDMDYKSPREVYQIVNTAYVVQTLDVAKLKHNTNYEAELQEHINMKKIKFIINKTIPCEITPKLINHCLKTNTNLETSHRAQIISDEVQMFIVPYSAEISKMAYEFSFDSKKLDTESFEAIKNIVQDIYPANIKTEKEGLFGKLSKLFKKEKGKVIKPEELAQEVEISKLESQINTIKSQVEAAEVKKAVSNNAEQDKVIKNNEIVEVDPDELVMEE